MYVKKGYIPCSAKDCFGCEDGMCVVLDNNRFGEKKCPFYKTREQVKQERADCELRLAQLRAGKEN